MAAATAGGNANPSAFAFAARHNLSHASRTVSLRVVDTEGAITAAGSRHSLLMARIERNGRPDRDALDHQPKGGRGLLAVLFSFWCLGAGGPPVKRMPAP